MGVCLTPRLLGTHLILVTRALKNRKDWGKLMFLGTLLTPSLFHHGQIRARPPGRRDPFLPAPGPDSHLQALNHPLKVVGHFSPHFCFLFHLPFILCNDKNPKDRLGEADGAGFPKSLRCRGKSRGLMQAGCLHFPGGWGCYSHLTDGKTEA